MSKEVTISEETALGSLESLKLGLSHAYYSVSKALRLNRLLDLLKRADLSPDTPIWLLGECYVAGSNASDANKQQIWTDLIHHFQSIAWATYRTNFSPLVVGEVQLRTDAGWGCTLRSLQMILAQALQRHVLGSNWRWPLVADTQLPPAAAAGGGYNGAMRNGSGHEERKELLELLELFWDIPSEHSPFSIHNLCRHGFASGVLPGRWLGPWVACRTAGLAAAHLPPCLNFHVAVLAGSGGGAPLLHKPKYETYFASDSSPRGAPKQNVGSSQLNWDSRNGNGVEKGHEQNDQKQQGGDGNGSSARQKQPGLLLLIPLVLGLGKLSPEYLPQLRATLGMPQSVGIIGGRPGSSLYFVGCQEDSVLYLDPHQIQEAACSDADWRTFQCDSLRTLPLVNIDPSLALGFYCSNLHDYRDLCQRLEALEPSYPLVCLTDQREGTGADGEEAVNDDWQNDDPSSSSSSCENNSEEEEVGERGVHDLEGQSPGTLEELVLEEEEEEEVEGDVQYHIDGEGEGELVSPSDAISALGKSLEEEEGGGVCLGDDGDMPLRQESSKSAWEVV